jgi:di/tricarboxylate transporter
VILNVASADDVFGSVFDSTILLFIIGSFIIAEAMLVHGLDRRLAFNILGLRWVGNSTYRIIIAFGFIGAATSPFMSNTGAAAMMLPIALGVMTSEGLTDRWLDEGVVAVLAAGLLFVLPIDWGRRQFTLNWNQASRIDWGTILLFGAGIALGGLMRDTGLAKTIGEGLANTLNVSSLVAITIVCVVIAVIISETTSNTASAAIGAVLCVVGVAIMASVVGLVERPP